MAADPTRRTVSRTVEVAAPAERVWALVSDLPGMGRFSPESTGGTWVGGATGPAVGARFAGTNASGSRTWSTRSTVVRCEPDRSFAFAVRAAGLRVATWAYDLEPVPGGCRVTETWTDQRGRVVTVAGRLLTGVEDRGAFASKSVEATLAAVKAAAER